MQAETELELFVNNADEQNLLLSSLNNQQSVLEWGSGKSTLAIARRVKHLVSIEHNNDYYNSTKKLLEENGITNTVLMYVPANEQERPGHDGTLEQFEDYVLAPIQHTLATGAKNKQLFDVVFVDGRARVDCAHYAAWYYLKPDGVIFIHDYRHPQPEYRRHEYEVVEDFLELTGHEFAMAKFKLK